MRCIIGYGVDEYTLNCALLSAIQYQCVDVAALLIDNGADFNANLRETHCHHSCWKYACGGWIYTIPYLRMVRLLLERGADANMVDAGDWSPLRASLKFDVKSGLAKLLLEYGADPNLIHARTGETALMIAALDARIDLVKLLLEHGADVTQVNHQGLSVLDMLGDDRYSAVRELCTQYIECNQPGARPLLK